MNEETLLRAYGLDLDALPHTSEVEPDPPLPRGIGVVGQPERAAPAPTPSSQPQRVGLILPTIRRTE